MTTAKEQYLLAAIVESSQDSIITIDLDRIITSWNKGAEHLYGYPAEEVIGQPLNLVMLPRDIHSLIDKVDDIIHEIRVPLYETVRIHKQGHELELEIFLSPVRDASGRIIGISAIARDITLRKMQERQQNIQRKKAELSELESKATVERVSHLLESVLGNTSSSIMLLQPVHDNDGTIADFEYKYTNDHLLQSVNRDVLVGRSIAEEFPGIRSTELFNRYRAVANGGGEWSGETHVNYDGFDVWAQVYATKVGEDLLVTYFDITERKKVEQELRKSRHLVQTVFDVSLNPIAYHKAVRDASGAIVDFEFQLENREARRYVTEDRTGKRYSEAYPGIRDTEVFRLYCEVVQTGNTLNKEVQLNLKGTDRWFQLMAAKLGDGLVATALDVTERKNAEIALQRQVELLRRSHSVLNCINEACYELDKDGLVTYVNRQALEWWNKQEDEVVGKNIWELFPESVSTHCYDAIQVGALEKGRYETFDYVSAVFHRWISLSATPTDSGCVVVFRDIDERKKAEQEVLELKDEIAKQAENKYRTLFESIDEGYLLADVIFDKNNQAIDILFVEANPAAIRIAGRDFANRRMREIDPDYEEYWYGVYGSVVLTGEPVRAEQYARAHNRWFDFHVSKVEGENGHRVTVVFQDITERKRRESNQALLIEMTDDLQLLTQTEEITKAVGARVGRYLNLSSCLFVDVDDAQNEVTVHYGWEKEGGPMLKQQTFRLSDYLTDEFARACRAGETTVIRDTANDARTDAEAYARIKVGAYVVVPFHREGRWVAHLVLLNESPYDWREDEIELGKNIADRVFPRIERAKAEHALRRSEAHLSATFEGLPVGIAVVDANGKTILFNKAMKRFLPEVIVPSRDPNVAHRWKSYNPDGTLVTTDNYPTSRALRGETVVPGMEFLFTRDDGVEIWTLVSSVPVRYKNGNVAEAVLLVTDINELKRTGEALHESEERLKTAQHAGNIGSWDFDAITGTIRWSETMWKLYGFERQLEKIEKEIWESCIHPDDRQRVMTGVAGLLKSGKTNYRDEFRILTQGGLPRWMESVGKMVRDASGKPVKMSGVNIDVTERKHAEEALRKSEDRFRTLADAVPQVIWTNTPDGEADYFNKRWYDYSGLSYEGGHGSGWQAIVHPEDAPASKARWNEALAAGTVFDAEYRLRGADGSYRWFIGRNVPLKDESGNVTGWFGSATDIQDLKAAQQELHESRERLRATMESAVEFAIITTDMGGIIQGWNKGAEAIFGYAEQEVIGKSADLIFTPEDRAAYVPQKEMLKARLEGRAEDERWHLRRDGSRFYMSGVTSPINDGQLKGYVKVARDMTWQKASEELLRLNEERYRAALKSADMAAWDWDVVADSIVWSEQHYLILGLEPDSTPKNAGFFIRFVHPEDVERIKAKLQEAVEKTGVYRAEFRIIRADKGETRWMSGYGRAVVEDANGRTLRMVGVMYDITERKVMEQQREHFIGIASHELRTPVTSLKAYTQMLEELFIANNDEYSAGLMRKMDRQVDRLTSLIYELLDSTRITEGKLQLRKADFAIDELIVDVVETMQRVSGNHHIELDLQARTTVHADADRIRQVLTNLISNGIKYAPGTDRIIVQSIHTNGVVTICIQDFGIGMDESTQRQLFEPFFRSEEASSFSGLGLGLYISAGIVRHHGGEITVESQPGEGSKFCFTIP